MRKRHVSKRKLSRRDFVKAAAGGAVGATSLGAIGASEARAAQTSAQWTHAADVVVVGAGATGLAAAVEAAQHGGSVVVIEQNDDVGGHAIQSGANIALGGGTSLQTKYGVVDLPDRMFADLVADLDYRYNDRDLVRAFADWSVSTFDWLAANGVVFPDEPPIGGRSQGVRRTHVPVWTGGVNTVSPTGANGAALVRPLEAAARKLGVQFLLQHSLTGVIRETVTSGRVVGITATHDGKPLSIEARKGVIQSSVRAAIRATCRSGGSSIRD